MAPIRNITPEDEGEEYNFSSHIVFNKAEPRTLFFTLLLLMTHFREDFFSFQMSTDNRAYYTCCILTLNQDGLSQKLQFGQVIIQNLLALG